ncbi:MAG TPA: hypothetical protein VND62_11530 [Acidimicrobiales bacterium]|nr:hypothetical protein [Acidimicrobiales bacterium]
MIDAHGLSKRYGEKVIIGRGRLVAQVPTGELLATLGHVRVRSSPFTSSRSRRRPSRTRTWSW